MNNDNNNTPEEGDGDGENNNGLIRWAKRKMGSIMWRMLPTTTTTTTTNSNKRQKIIGRIVFDDDDLNNNVSNNNANNKLVLVTLLFSPRLPFTKVMSYLEPCDILNCIQTCKKWKCDMNKDEIWHEVLVANSSFSSRNGALDAIINSNTTTNNNNNNNNNTQEENENNNDDATMITTAVAAAAKSNSKSNSNTSNSNTLNSNINSKLNYRNMAIAMYRKMNDYEEGIPQTFPKSKLNSEDVFVVIEIRDKLVDIDDDDNDDLTINNNNNNNDYYKQLGSFCSDLTELTENKPGRSKYISYDPTINNNNRNNCLSDTILQSDDRCGVPGETFEMSSRLIRQDTGKCIVLNDYEILRNYKKGLGLGFRGCFRTENELKPQGKNLAGTIARDVCYQYNYNHIGFDLDFIIERLQVVSDYEYRIKSFQLSVTVSKGSGSGDDDDENDENENEKEFNSMNHFLLFLEGLDWK